MNITANTIGFPKRLHAALGLLSLGLWFALPRADGSACEPPDEPSGPAAGDYKGFFRLSCEMHMPASPPLVIPMMIEGDLTFSLGRPEATDPPQPAPPAPKNRRPLRPPTPPRSTPPDAEAVDAVQEATLIEAALAAAMARANDNYIGLYVPPNENARLEGVSNISMDANFQYRMADAQMSGQTGTKRTMPFEIRGEEEGLTGEFEELTLWGTQDQSAFAGSFNAAGPGASAWGNLDFHATGATGHVTGVSESGRVDRDVSITTGGSSSSSPPNEDKYQRQRREFDEAYDRLFGKPQARVKMITLTVTATDCWLLRGTVRAEQMEENLKQWGAQLVVKDSEWMATLDQREPDFEARVRALAAEPIPNPITWSYIDSFSERWRALRAEAKSDYHRCVLKELGRKYLALNVAALSELSKEFPKARHGANCTAYRAAFERGLTIIRTLELFGMGDCPVISDYWKNASTEVQQSIKELLARSYTPRELACYLGASTLVDLGEQAQPFWDAWHKVEVAANAQHP